MVTCILFNFEPRVGFETHQAHLSFTSYKEHDITVCLFLFTEQLLLNHLRVINEADELPLAEVDYPLVHILSHMNNSYLFVVWGNSLVS